MKAFEAWISAPPFERDITRYPMNSEESAWPGHYREYEVQLAWEAWEAAAETIRVTLADPAKTHVLMLRGDIAWTEPNLRHVLEHPFMLKMKLCPICGNKRCPKATDEKLDCTNSNKPGQPGSAY